MEGNINICRICLKVIEETNISFAPITNNSSVLQSLNLISCGTIRNLQLTDEPIICEFCIDKLKEYADFKENIITNEFKIQCHQKKEGNIFLKKISTNFNDICRLCLKICKPLPFSYLKHWKDNKFLFVKCNIHLNVNITNPSVMCGECYQMLINMYKFVCDSNEKEKLIMYRYSKNSKQLDGKDLLDVFVDLEKYKLEKLKFEKKKIREGVDPEKLIKMEEYEKQFEENNMEFEENLTNVDNEDNNNQNKGISSSVSRPKTRSRLKKEVSLPERNNEGQVEEIPEQNSQRKTRKGRGKKNLEKTGAKTLQTAAINLKTVEETFKEVEENLKRMFDDNFANEEGEETFIQDPVPLTNGENLETLVINHVEQESPIKSEGKKRGRKPKVKDAPENSVKVKQTPRKYKKRKPNDETETPSAKKNKSSKVEGSTLECSRCPFRTRSHQVLIQHKLIHNVLDSVQKYKCQICQFQCKTQDLLKEHLETHTSNASETQYLNFGCIFCDFKAKKKISILNHTVRHEKQSLNRQFYCLVLVFNQIDQDDKLYECLQCEFQSEFEEVFADHFLQHQKLKHATYDMKMFDCDLCSYKTKDVDRLERHRLLHINQEIKPESLVKGNEPTVKQSCMHCDFTTNQKRSLSNHIAMKHKKDVKKDKPDTGKLKKMFYCAQCPYKTVRKNNMPRHILVHKTKENMEVLECPYCPFETKHRRSYTRHLETIHAQITKDK